MTRDECIRLDENDLLSPWKQAFLPPRNGIIHLDGCSIGPVPSALPGKMTNFLLKEWSVYRSHGWMKRDWVNLPRRLGDKLAPLIGAEPGEVVFCDSTSVNLFKLLVGALGLRPGRRLIVSEKANFPTDLYIAQGITRLFEGRYELHLVEHDDELLAAIDESTVVVFLTHVNYLSGRRHDMAKLNAWAHEKGALTIWDLSHSAGAIPVDLKGTKADLAVGCGYKYLNGGPGAPAYIWVSKDLQARIEPPIAGWMGHEAREDFEMLYRPARGVERNLAGAPVVLGMVALEAALEIWPQVDTAQVFKKSELMSDILIDLVETQCAGYGLVLASPRDTQQRGSHVAFRHSFAGSIVKALEERGVIGGFRRPDIIRLGITPLTLRYVDLWDATRSLAEILKSRSYTKFSQTPENLAA